MKKIMFLFLFVLLSSDLLAQPGFSKIYRYEGDTSRRAEGIFTLIYDNHNQSLYFATSGFPHNNPSLLFSESYKTDLQGNVLQKKMDTIANGGISCNSVIASRNENICIGGDGNTYLTPCLIQLK